jgi:hypothetical protein
LDPIRAAVCRRSGGAHCHGLRRQRYTAAQVQTNTQTQGAANAYGLSVPAGDFVLTLYNAATNTPSCGNQVTVTYPFTFIASDLFPFHITLTATACHMG